MLDNEQIKQIKRINRRLAQMEESGYKDTSLYNDLLIRIEQSGLQIREDKNGNTRLSQSAKQEVNFNINIDLTLNWIERVKTLKQAQKEYRKDKGIHWFILIPLFFAFLRSAILLAFS